MKRLGSVRVFMGVAIWIGIVAGVYWFARGSIERSPSAARQLVEHLGKRRHVVRVNFPERVWVAVGDPVFLDGSESYAPIGHVTRVESETSTDEGVVAAETAFVTFYGNAPPVTESDVLYYHEVPGSTEWVLKTMLPPEKRAEIASLILQAYQDHQDELLDSLRPIVRDSLVDASRIIKEDMKAAFAKRKETLRKISQKYQTELVDKKLIPLIESEIWPLVEKKSKPLASKIGTEIWTKVSVFDFGWRYLYDRSPLPEKNLTEKEFQRFVDEEAVPILLDHLDEIVGLAQELLQEISKNERVRKTVTSSFEAVLNDPEIQALLTDVFQEVFVNNARLKRAMEAHWKSPQARHAIDLASQALEPTINDIGVLLFGSPHDKITPEFARILRHRILYKDERWLTLVPSSDPDASRFPESMAAKIAIPPGNIPYAPSRKQH